MAHRPTEPLVVLIADDEKAYLELYSTRFTMEGFKVLVAHDGQQAEALAMEHHPAAMLLDVRMPQKDGIEVLRNLRADEATAGIPVIMLSAIDDIADVRAALALGAECYLIKGNETPAQVVAKVRECAKKK